MAVADLYEMRFEWPHPEPTTVIVTGTFDQWSRSVELKRSDGGGFVASVPLPWAEKIKYKFIVDGRWLTQAGQPTETDPGGFVNNIFFTPPRPVAVPERSPPAPSPAVEETQTNGHAEPVAEAPTEPAVEEPTVTAEGAKEEVAEKAEIVAEQPEPEVSPKPSRKLSIPVVPVNSSEHNTINLATPPPAVPDFVLPPPRARSASPSVAEVAPTPSPALVSEPEPVKLHEVEVVAAEEPVPEVVVAPEAPVEEKKLEVESHIPVDCSDPVKEPVLPKVEDTPKPGEELAQEIVAPPAAVAPSTPPPAAKPLPSDDSEKKVAAPPVSALPTPPTTPAATKKDSTFPRGGSPPSTPGSPSSAKFDTGKSRKKRHSLFGKLKDIFGGDKEKVKSPK